MKEGCLLDIKPLDPLSAQRLHAEKASKLTLE